MDPSDDLRLCQCVIDDGMTDGGSIIDVVAHGGRSGIPQSGVGCLSGVDLRRFAGYQAGDQEERPPAAVFTKAPQEPVIVIEWYAIISDYRMKVLGGRTCNRCIYICLQQIVNTSSSWRVEDIHNGGSPTALR